MVKKFSENLHGLKKEISINYKYAHTHLPSVIVTVILVSIRCNNHIQIHVKVYCETISKNTKSCPNYIYKDLGRNSARVKFYSARGG